MNVIALILSLIGSFLLFFYGFPAKKVGNVFFYGNLAMESSPVDGERAVPREEWEPQFNAFKWRAKFFNRLGFAMITLGMLLQLVALAV
ncbi:hypothetical protein [Lysobacter sp. TY2-98]|uniref:hypothetical protein n=1 Tax=Lysobacter sp. TY2-98 TaxID=2290922 RepID=UPI0013B41BE4|nr:hypothetical protein [Lysobacter sp. TY2-98]